MWDESGGPVYPEIKYLDELINLNDITWSRSSAGVYYKGYLVNLQGVGTVLSATLQDWGKLRDTDNLTLYIQSDGDGVGLMANTNSFYENAAIIICVVYI